MANTTWSTTDKTASITLSGGNLVATSSGLGAQNVRAIDRQTSGKYYWEVTPTGGIGGAIGIAAGDVAIGSLTNNTGTGSAGAVWVGNTGAVSADNVQLATGLGSFTASSAVCIALDLNARLIWFRTTPAGNWNGSASNNPATGVGGYGVRFGATLAAYPVTINFNNNTGVQTANFGDTAFSGTVPSGFTSGFPTGTPANIASVSAAVREVLSSGAASLYQSTLAREVLLSQVTQLWQSTLAREVLLTGDPVAGVRQTFVSVSVS